MHTIKLGRQKKILTENPTQNGTPQTKNSFHIKLGRLKQQKNIFKQNISNTHDEQHITTKTKTISKKNKKIKTFSTNENKNVNTTHHIDKNKTKKYFLQRKKYFHITSCPTKCSEKNPMKTKNSTKQNIHQLDNHLKHTYIFITLTPHPVQQNFQKNKKIKKYFQTQRR